MGNSPTNATDPSGLEGYWHGVGQVYLGYWDAAKGTASGLYQVARHPIQTAKGLATSVAHPYQTYEAIRDDIVNKSSSLRGQGSLVGDVLIGVAGGGVVKAASKTATVAKLSSKIANTRVGKAVGTVAGATIGRATRAAANTRAGKAVANIKSVIARGAQRVDNAIGAISGRGSNVLDPAGNITTAPNSAATASTRVNPWTTASRSYIGADRVTPQGGFARYGALDDLGRPTQMQARVTQEMIGSGTAASRSIQPPGFITGARGANRARRHLLGDQLGGSGREFRNLVTLEQNAANSPVTRGFETSVRQAVESGQVVDYDVTPLYNFKGRIPRGVTLQARGSGGFRLDVTLLNPPGL